MDRWRDAGVKNQRALFLLHVGQSGVIALGVGAIMLLAGQDVLAGRMRVGDLVLINAYALQVCLPLNALGFVYRESRDAWVNAERLFALLGERPEMPDMPGQPALVPGAAEVVFEHVGFDYEPGRTALDDVSLRIPPGTTLAVVGRSGSGKSTLARLLLRFYDPDRGRIHIDGQDIRHCSPPACAARSVSCRRMPRCSTTRWPATSATRVRARDATRSRRRQGRRNCTTRSPRCRTATTAPSASGA
jgi:ATP-binding cassette subfamily B protein